MKIGTHNGTFHCDDVVACAMLKLLPEYGEADIIRTRDQDVLDECDIVVDVGGEFDHKKKRYDHHQQGFTTTMRDISSGKMKWNTKLSSAGLIYWFYGKKVICHFLQIDKNEDAEQLEYVFQNMYKDFIQEIDEIDNGNRIQAGNNLFKIRTGISTRIASLNPDWRLDVKDKDYDEKFLEALKTASDEFVSKLKLIGDSTWAARVALKEKLENKDSFRRNGKVLFFDKGEKYLPWPTHLDSLQKQLKIPKIDFIVGYDETNKDWKITSTVENGPDKLLFPADWRGLKDGKLVKVSKIDGVKFVHSNGYLAVVKDEEICYKVIDVAYEYSERENLSKKMGRAEVFKEVGNLMNRTIVTEKYRPPHQRGRNQRFDDTDGWKDKHSRK